MTLKMNKNAKKIKKISLLAPIIFTLIFSSFVTINVPHVKAGSAVMITLFSWDSEEISPGDCPMLTITVINTERTGFETDTIHSGNEAYYDSMSNTLILPEGTKYVQHQRDFTAIIEKIWIEMPTSNLTTSGAIKDIGEIAPGGSFSVSFLVKSDINITEGVYFPVVHINVDGGSDVNFPIPLKVSSEIIEVLAKNAPSKISINGATDITLTVVNRLSCVMKNVLIDVADNEEITISPNRIFVGMIEAYSSRDVVFSLKPNSTGMKDVIFEVQFKNSDKIHKKYLNISTEVIDTADVEIIFHTMPSVIKKGNIIELDLEIFNAKTTPIGGVTVVPICNEKIFPSKYFIGEMNSDDVFSAHFTIETDTLKLGEHNLEFKVIFKQGNDFFETSAVTVDYFIKDDSSGFATIFYSVQMMIISGVITIVMLFLFIHFHIIKRIVGIWSRMKYVR